MLAEDVRDLFEIGQGGDDRGFSLIFKKFPVQGFHIASVEPGAMRGNHVHVYDEILCITGGGNLAEISLESAGTHERMQVRDPYHMIRISSGVKHAVKNVDDYSFYLVGFSTEGAMQLGKTINIEH